MAIINLFSKRQKASRGELPDVYIYDVFPQPLRVQIVHIWKDSLGSENDYEHSSFQVKGACKFIVETLCREYGVFSLVGRDSGYRRNYLEEMINFILKESDTEKVMDIVELSFRLSDRMGRSFNYRYKQNASEIIDNAIAELNSRFKEHGVGYQYEQGDIIRVDSQIVHSEVVKPALRLLNESKFSGAEQEFLNAYEHYRHGKHKEALNDALKSFESTLKAICDKRGWQFNPNDTSKRLIEICYQHNLIPAFWQQQMSALRSLLEGGVPTGRNKLSGHGQGTIPTVVPEHIVAYVLHMAAASIVFLVNSERDLK